MGENVYYRTKSLISALGEWQLQYYKSETEHRTTEEGWGEGIARMSFHLEITPKLCS
jgi:hypothetical protein